MSVANDSPRPAARTEPSAAPRPPATLADYVSIARPDHWFKHVFMIPGLVLAYALAPSTPTLSLWSIVLGFVSAAAIASANYTINEWLDAEFDRHHPTKSLRPAVAKDMSGRLVFVQHALLALLGLAAGALISTTFLAVSVAFLISGWVYNIRPLRSKDKAYVDVTTEAINNPIRLMLGWAIVDSTTLPPSSLLIAYWMGGAFLMAVKRFSEFRQVTAQHGPNVLPLYRASFKHYTENRLLLFSFICALMAAFFIAVFLIKYRIEYIVSLPFFALLFATYLWMGLKEGSNAQTPEKLFREKELVGVTLALLTILLFLTFVDLPFLSFLSDPHYIELRPQS